MSNISKRRKDCSRNRYKMMNDHSEFLQRITKSLYYGRLPSMPCLSLPVTELSAELFSEAQKGKSLKRLHVDDAAELTRGACVSPCSLVLALLYLERLKTANPDYVSRMAPSELFLVSLMVSNKFLQDDGEEDEVFSDEWATSGGITSEALHKLERNFLHAIDWRIYVNDQNFETALEWLEHQVALRQTKLRGWFTYTDLTNISNNIECFGLMKCLVTVYLALSVSYVASVTTLLASSLIVSHSSLIFNNPALLNTFGIKMSFSPGKENNMNLTENEIDHGEALIDTIFSFEDKLKTSPVPVTANTPITPNNLVSYFNSNFNTPNDNRTSSFISNPWPCSSTNLLSNVVKRIFNHGYGSYMVKLFKEYLFVYGDIMEKTNLKDAYFTSKHWLSHWKHQGNQYYSIVGPFPGTVALTC